MTELLLHRKLEQLQLKAERCLTREQAQQILREAKRTHAQLTQH